MMLDQVKVLLGITGDFLNDTISGYIAEVTAFLLDAGVAEHNITPGIVARGVSDLWQLGAGEGKLSQYFIQRASQLALKTNNTEV